MKRNQFVATKSGRVERLSDSESEGIGVRVRVGGAWGFAATRDTGAAGAEEALRRAVEIAKAQPSAPAVALVPVEPAEGSWCSGYGRDPFEVPVAER